MPPARHLARAFLLATLLPIAALAQREDPAPPPIPVKLPPIPKGRVIGHVTCNDTHQPARAAMVILMPLPTQEKQPEEGFGRAGGLLTARVGMDGSYVIEHVPAATYAVVAYLPGYLAPLDGLTVTQGDSEMNESLRKRISADNTVHLAKGATQTADLLLERGATLSGRVLYSDGAPATQVTLELEDVNAVSTPPKAGEMNMNIGTMFRTMFTRQTLSTDDQGHFRLAGIHAGTYRLAITQPFTLSDLSGGERDESGIMLGMISGMTDPQALRFYAGDTLHRKAAKTYELRAGDTLDGIDIRIPIDGLHPLRVRLSAPDGRLINRATLTLVDTADDTLIFAGINRQEGQYEFAGVPPGTYTLQAKAAFYSPGQPYAPPTAAFADGSAAVLIKDSDPAEVLLTLKEIPLPKPTPEPE